MLKHRLILGPILIITLIAALWLDEHLDHSPLPDWARLFLPSSFATWPPSMILFPLGMLIVVQAARELAAMFKTHNIRASRRWLGFAAALGLIVCALVPSTANPIDAVALVATAGVAVILSSLLWHIRDRELHGATAAAGAAVFAFIYLGLMAGFLLALRRDQSAWSILAVILIIKSADIGAFAAGKTLGKHKLIPWLSPGKTWEGFLGGCLLAAAVAVIISLLAKRLHLPEFSRPIGFADLSILHAALVGLLFALVGQAGDLLESILKRDAGFKDSGSILPGFGGVLDIADSVLLVAPFAYWILTRT